MSEDLETLVVRFTANMDDLLNAGSAISKIFDSISAAADMSTSDMTASITQAAESFSSISDAAIATSSSIDESVSQVNTEIDSIATNASGVADEVNTSFSGFDLGGMINQVGMSIFSLQALGNMAVQTAQSLLGPASQAENTQASFSNLLGSTQAATKELDQLNNFAAKTQFKTQDIDNMAASMIAFKTPTRDIVPELSAVGDALTAVGKGTPAEMQSVVDILGKIGIQGKLTQGDITQLGAHGINALDLIAEGSGKTTKQIQDMIAKGTLPAQNAIDDLTKGIEKNPVYSGGMAKQSNTLSGQLSTLGSDWDQVMAAMAKPALPELESGFSKLTTIISSPSFKAFAVTVGQDVVTGINDLITGFGNLVSTGESIANFFEQNQTAMDALEATLAGVGAVILDVVVSAFVAWAIAMLPVAIEATITALPFIALGLIVGAVVFGIIEAVQHWGQIMGWIHGIGDDVAHGFHAAWDGMGAFFSGIGAAIWNGIKWGINQAIGGLDDFINWLDSIHIDIPHVDAGPLQIAGGSIGLPHIPTIPMLASGGLLGAGTWGIVGEQGPELAYGGATGMSVFSNAQSQAMMSYPAMSSSMMGSGQPQEIHVHNHNHIYIDGQELSDVVGNRMMRNTRLQSGRRM